MTAQILHIRDYKTAEERQLEIDRMGLAAVEGALYPNPGDRGAADGQLERMAGYGGFEGIVGIDRSPSPFWNNKPDDGDVA